MMMSITTTITLLHLFLSKDYGRVCVEATIIAQWLEHLIQGHKVTRSWIQVLVMLSTRCENELLI